MNLKEKAKELKHYLPAIFLSLKDKDNPFLIKLLGFLIIGYALSPIDLIPDFIPVLGYLDDVLLLPGLIALYLKLLPKELWNTCLEASKDMWKDGKPKKWYYAIPIVLIWLLIIYKILSSAGIF